MLRRRDDYEDPHNPDGLSDEELEDMRSPIYTEASDAAICRMADHGDPVADEIFYSWPKARQDAAARAVDDEDKKQ
ncbi:hypothetical protein ABZ543_12655 [Streptomyces roseifaciens]